MQQQVYMQSALYNMGIRSTKTALALQGTGLTLEEREDFEGDEKRRNIGIEEDQSICSPWSLYQGLNTVRHYSMSHKPRYNSPRNDVNTLSKN
jgi:hypothetical protein